MMCLIGAHVMFLIKLVLFSLCFFNALVVESLWCGYNMHSPQWFAHLFTSVLERSVLFSIVFLLFDVASTLHEQPPQKVVWEINPPAPTKVKQTNKQTNTE